MVRAEAHPTEGETWAIGAPNRFSGGEAPAGRPAPLLGQDNEDVLRGAGLDAAEIAALRDGGALVEETP
jgi:crotonobetainyl-CoA:carnitine CoA-transferase CaiB-like acyl-CoA transferase